MAQQPEYNLSFDDDSGKVVDVTHDKATNSLAKAALTDVVGEAPEITPPLDNSVLLPYGFARADGEWVTTGEVKELNGEAEEALAKAKGNPSRWVKTLLTHGVETLGDEKPNAAALRSLLIGDRDALVLGIRRVTFGNDFSLVGFPCPNCNELLDITVSLGDIPCRTLEQGKSQFTYVLRRGGEATIRMPGGGDQEKIFEGNDQTDAQRNSILLAQCVVTLPEGPVQGSLTKVNALGVADRRGILEAIAEKAPGPRYDEVSYEHECGTTFPLELSVGALFQGL